MSYLGNWIRLDQVFLENIVVQRGSVMHPQPTFLCHSAAQEAFGRFPSHCARKKLQQLPRSRSATFHTSSLQRTSDVSTWMCLFPTWSHTDFSANMARGSPQLFQCLCTAVFSTGNVTGTAGPQILTCPALGPNALRKADCTTLSLSAQADTRINTTNKMVTTIIVVLILINKNVKQHTCSYGKSHFSCNFDFPWFGDRRRDTFSRLF